MKIVNNIDKPFGGNELIKTGMIFEVNNPSGRDTTHIMIVCVATGQLNAVSLYNGNRMVGENFAGQCVASVENELKAKKINVTTLTLS